MAVTPETVLRREAWEIKKYRLVKRIVTFSILALITMLMLVYIVSALYTNSGSFTVSVMKYDKLKYSICLSEDESFITKSAELNCIASEDITNISSDSIPDDVDNIGGVHSGTNYLAYTFYVMNNGTLTLDYSYDLYISNITKELDKAARVRLYINGEATTYARTATDGSGAEPGTVEFATGNTIVKGTITNFAPGDITKYTVVIWLEGDDPDCIDDKIGGEFKVDMTMEVLGLDEESESK